MRREGITCSDPRKAVSPGVALGLPHAPPPAIESGLRTFRSFVDQASNVSAGGVDAMLCACVCLWRMVKEG